MVNASLIFSRISAVLAWFVALALAWQGGGHRLADLPNCWWEIPPTFAAMNGFRQNFGGKLQLA
jgi:hypothetical protein